MIFIEGINLKHWFGIEKSNLKKPIDKEIIFVQKTPHQSSRASYLNLKNFYSKVEKGQREGLGARDFSIIKQEANDHGYTCPHCQKEFNDYASIDHKLPYYYGGKSHHSNLEIVCEYCNHTKGALNPTTTPQAYTLFQKKRLEGSTNSCLDIINETLQNCDDSSEIKQLIKLKKKEEEWREVREAKKAS